MANIIISKIKVRRGTNDQRKKIILDQGELGYTIDTNRLFVGNGTKVGGNAIGSKIHPPIESISSLTNVVAEIGDIVWVNGIFYQLIDDEYDKIESWKNIGTYLDSTYFQYNNSNQITLKNNVIKLANLASDVTNKFLTLADESTIEYGVNNKLTIKNLGVSNTKIQNSAITNDKINLNVVGNGLIGGAGQSISINADPNLFYFENGRLMLYEANFATSVDNVTVKINANNEFAVKENAITETYINNLAFSDGIVGGNGSKIRLNANTDVFTFTNSKLDLQSEFIDESKLKSSIFANGIEGGAGDKVSLNIDNTIFEFNPISALTIKLSSIEGKYISEFAVGDGLIKDINEQRIKIKADPTFFSFDAQTLQIAPSAINHFQINPGSLGIGLAGGGVEVLRVDVHGNDFSFTTGGQLILSEILRNSPLFNDNPDILSAGSTAFTKFYMNAGGRAYSLEPGIMDTLSGVNTNNMFNGSVLQNSRNTNQTFMSAVNSSNEIVRLSSAGFIAFESGLTTLSGVALSSKPLRRFAIPVFTF
jgi:hypothetical protein